MDNTQENKSTIDVKIEGILSELQILRERCNRLEYYNGTVKALCICLVLIILFLLTVLVYI